MSQAGTNLDETFKSSMMEPKLVIFYEENSQQLQMFVCAENEVAFEVPIL